ncbi:probable DNA metabolism protein [Salegentibacter holothuriorum]|uniref:Probable DNA metabolism protein n=1 Tax=Salegentibacter holothuriorum TaxID=241145 RepID=A0A1T5DSD6_9FLAO|nr:TIGR03915 family putative DNA repair protein [Salegentibacter holothuriorum]SKB74571.1 probable DNA metabolism protein [Salegentibacter holothuriorum]
MKPTTCLIYDGTFKGLLTCVYTVFEEKILVNNILPPGTPQTEMFAENIEVLTDEGKAKRVWKGFIKYATQRGQNAVYYAYLSEIPKIELDILRYMQHTFNCKTSVDGDFTNTHVLKIAQTAKKVGREKHRMEAFVRFQLTKDNIYFSNIEPDFNVLPIIEKHFTSRYSDQQWIIYDLKRNFGLYYDLEKPKIIHINFSENSTLSEEKEHLFDTSEIEFQKLWKKYFEATTIKSRINTRLHKQHMPKRYWRYLSEKNPLHN